MEPALDRGAIRPIDLSPVELITISHRVLAFGVALLYVILLPPLLFAGFLLYLLVRRCLLGGATLHQVVPKDYSRTYLASTSLLLDNCFTSIPIARSLY